MEKVDLVQGTAGRRTRRAWLLTAVLSAAGGFALSAGVILAANPNSTSGTHNGCAYSGYSQFSTPPGYYSYSQTYSSCAVETALSAFWYDSGGNEWSYRTGFIDVSMFGPLTSVRNLAIPTVNVYGYHQIRKPNGVDSPTRETHAQ